MSIKVNGINYGWGDVDVKIPGLNLVVQEISYDDEQEMEESYGEIELRQALERLPLRDKVILELRYFEEMKLEEIAKITEEPISTVKSRLYRSLKKLRLSFEQED